MSFIQVSLIYTNGRSHKLHDALSDDARRSEAMEILRTMIEKVIVTATGDETEVALHGELGAMMHLAESRQKESPGQLKPRHSFSVVAGVGFEPTTFRL